MPDVLVVTDTEYLIIEGKVTQTLQVGGALELLEIAVQGPPGPPGLASPPIAFSFGDASPRPLFTTTASSLVLSVRVNITTPFNGAGPTLRIGKAGQPELLLAAAQLDLSVATEFEINPNCILASGQRVLVALAPGIGATQGAGWIVIEQIPAT